MSEEREGDFSLTLDPDLIEAALASVEKSGKKGKKAKKSEPVAAPPEPEVADEVLFDPGEWGEPPPDGVPDLEVIVETAVEAVSEPAEGDPTELLRLRLQLREANDTIGRLEARLARATELGDGLGRQVRDLRGAVRQLEQDGELARQRHRKERDEAERRAEENAVRGLIEVVDNVDRAVAYAETDSSRIMGGLTIIREQFRQLLRRLGIDRIDASPGVAFDPAVHDAVLHQPTGDQAEGHVLAEISGGYRLRGRLLQPARVVVAAKPPDPEPG